jgi:hypothetical protein
MYGAEVWEDSKNSYGGGFGSRRQEMWGKRWRKTARTALQVFAAADGWWCVGETCEKTAGAALEVVAAADGWRCGGRG